MSVREPAVAGLFYPATREELSKEIDGLLKAARAVAIKGRLRGLIVPHAGYAYSGPVAAVGYRALRAQKLDVSEVVLLGPAHHLPFEGLALAESERWCTPIGELKVAVRARELLTEPGVSVLEEAHAPEHCLEVQLPFLQTVLARFEIVPLLTGQKIDLARSSELLARFLGQRSFLVVSSDLSHFLPYERARAVDAATCSAVSALDLQSFERVGDACGKSALEIAMALSRRCGWSLRLLSYANSGDTGGDKRKVVGYACWAICE